MKHNLAFGVDVSGARGNLACLYLQICGDPACKISTHSLYSIISNLSVLNWFSKLNFEQLRC
jgi:hypothetical protein